MYITETKTKTLELAVGGRLRTTVEKCDVQGLYDRIIRKVASNPDCRTIVLDMSGLTYTNHNIIDMIEQCKEETRKEKRRFEVRNVYGQPAEILDFYKIKYLNDP